MDSRVSRLLVAAEQGNLHQVTDLLLEKGYHVDWTDEEGVNALHIAAANGNDNVVRLLLSRGASLEAKTIYGWTALMLASCNGHLIVCWTLLQHKSDIHAKNFLGSTALECAARNGHVQIVALLIEACGQQVLENSTTSLELSLNASLINAAEHGQESTLRLLLEKGADVNFREETTGWTALMLAALNGHMAAAQLLVEFGADTNAQNVINQTALEVAIVRQKTEVQEFLDERTSTRPQITGQKSNRPCIVEAARTGNLVLVRELLYQGEVDKNSTDEDGATPLMYAAMGGHLPVVQLLIDIRADIDKQDKVSGWTALMQATYHGYTEIARLLIESGADVNIQGNNGCRAFDIGCIFFPYLSDFLKVQGGKLRWWSKLSGRFRNLSVNRTFSSNKIRGMHLSKSMEELAIKEKKEEGSVSELPRSVSTVSAVTLRSLASVITDSALKRSGGYRPQSLALVSHVTKLPDDVITPVVPPPLPSSSFELPSLQHHNRNGSVEKGSRAGHPSSISAYSTFLPSPTHKKGEGGKVGSPDSSYSNASFYSSTSYNSGSRTLRASSPLSDTAINQMSAMSSSLWYKAGRSCISPMPTLISVQSVPDEDSAQQQESGYSSLHGYVDYEPRCQSTQARSSFCNTFESCEDDVENLLKKLSLEKYQSNFEEQEVDMEAFLTLNDSDLTDLGVTQKFARQQILTAISELNCGKDRQRQHQHEALSNYHGSKSPGSSGYVSPSSGSNLPP
ncbi:PREDICTED: ankyrin repeat and SAM domain-containing protein 6-like [Acropora digitifera]|uniref:ankyrin repeat and SAM domain-containing protein 6-like n=1 Tax=Acropora digitifera TaxID=70779 RepID=UPI00077AE596|nr:PREDICTED: ankyrin repeat and SAM domain-containing protein 6-like [Acropora digitifera]